jgi:hypothetical protein
VFRFGDYDEHGVRPFTRQFDEVHAGSGNSGRTNSGNSGLPEQGGKE